MEDMKSQREVERQRIIDATAIERGWWTDDKKYAKLTEAMASLSTGIMVKVPPYGVGYKLLRRLGDSEPDILQKTSFHFMEKVFSLWHGGLSGQDKEVHLAVLSLYRSLDDQIKINDSPDDTYRSVSGMMSSHLAGAAFDVSMRSYYLYVDGEWRPIRNWEPSEANLFHQNLILRFLDILYGYQERKFCNVVVEKNISDVGCFDTAIHVCVNPVYLSMEV